MNQPAKRPLLDCRNVDKSFLDGERSLVVFQDLNLSIETGQSIAIIGRSGSGKTTLMHMIAGLEGFDAGQILLNGADIRTLGGAERDRCHLQDIGLVFQFHFLLPDFSACENAAMPLLTAGMPSGRALAKGKEMLSRVGLAERASHLPSALSGGERQRVAIARALINRPSLVIADEPTGNLDSTTAESMVTLLLEQTAAQGSSLLVATHDSAIAARVDNCYELSVDGLSPKPSPP